MNPVLEGYTAAIFEEVGLSPILADELQAIERLIESHPDLRSALTDTAVAPSARRGVLSDLLQGKVSDWARRLAGFAVGAVPAPDVLAALGWLYRRAEVGELELSLLGHSAARQRVGGYATAVFEETGTTALEEVEDELFRFARIVESNPELLRELSDREVPVDIRRAVVEDLLTDRVEPATLRLVRFVVEGGRPRDFVGALDWLVERTAEARGWRVGRVRSAEPIDEPQRDRLAQALSQVTGRPVELQVTLDPRLIGGAVIVIGDLQVDASARGRLERLREELLPAGAERAGQPKRARGEP